MSETEESSPSISRRTLMRGAAAAGAAGTVGLAGSAGSASAAVPVAVAAGLAGATGLTAGGLAGYYVGSYYAGPDEEDKQDASDYDNWTTWYTIARENSTLDETVMSSFRTNISMVSNGARREAIFRIYEAGQSGLTESEAEDAAEEGIRDHFSELKKQILNHYVARAERFSQAMELLDGDNFDTDPDEVLYVKDYHSGSFVAPTGVFDWDSGSDPPDDMPYNLATPIDGSMEVYLPDGSIHHVPGDSDYHGDKSSDGSAWTRHPDPSQHPTEFVFDSDAAHDDLDGKLSNPTVREPDSDLYEEIDAGGDFDGPRTFVDFEEFYRMLIDLDDELSSMLDEINTLMDMYWEDAQSDDVDLVDLIGSEGLIDAAKDADDFREAALVMRVLGVPRSETAVRLEFDHEGEVYDTDAYLGWSIADEDDTLTVGSPIDPATLPGSFFAAFNVENEDGEIEGELGELTDTFTIIATEDDVGEELGFEPKGVVSSDMDPEDVRHEFEESAEARQDAEDARQTIELDAGGIGLPTIGGLNPGQWIAAAAVVIGGYLLLDSAGD